MITTERVRDVAGARPGDSLTVVYRDGERIGSVTTRERSTGYQATRDRRNEDGKTLTLIDSQSGFLYFPRAIEWVEDQ